jgi:hypothetical protein
MPARCSCGKTTYQLTWRDLASTLKRLGQFSPTFEEETR